MGCAQSQPSPSLGKPKLRRTNTVEDPWENDEQNHLADSEETDNFARPQLRRKSTSDSLGSSGSSCSGASGASSAISLQTDNVQATTMKNTKGSPNQDTYCVVEESPGFCVYGVFDGHGKRGHRVSKFVKDHLPRIILRDSRLGSVAMPSILHDAFASMEQMLAEATKTGAVDAARSGTTATVIVHDKGAGQLTVSHVGDSGAALAKAKGSSFKAQYLTPDHKPDVPKERKRLIKAGGAVNFDGSCWRCYVKGAYGPELNMSRSFGDLCLRSGGIISEPDTVQLKLTKKDMFLLMCSDGVWELMSASEAVDCVRQALKGGKNAAHELAKEASDRWGSHRSADDITVLIVFLHMEVSRQPVKVKSALKRSSSNLSSVSEATTSKKALPKTLERGYSHSSVGSSISSMSNQTCTKAVPAKISRSVSDSSVISTGPLHTSSAIQKSIPRKSAKDYLSPEEQTSV